MASWMEERTLQPSFDNVKGGLLKLNYCWIDRESWHAIKKVFKLLFLTLKVRYPTTSLVIGFSYYWGGYSNEFKWIMIT